MHCYFQGAVRITGALPLYNHYWCVINTTSDITEELEEVIVDPNIAVHLPDDDDDEDESFDADIHYPYGKSVRNVKITRAVRERAILVFKKTHKFYQTLV